MHILNAALPNTGWRRPIGCFKLQVIFRKRTTNYRALLRKWPIQIRHPMTLRHPVVNAALFETLQPHDSEYWITHWTMKYIKYFLRSFIHMLNAALFQTLQPYDSEYWITHSTMKSIPYWMPHFSRRCSGIFQHVAAASLKTLQPYDSEYWIMHSTMKWIRYSILSFIHILNAASCNAKVEKGGGVGDLSPKFRAI